MSSGQGQLFGGDWTQQKLDILESYLRAYTTALKNQPFTLVYIDAFAGTGYREQRKTDCQVPDLFAEIDGEESARFLEGSAKRALKVVPPFHKYVFVELSADKLARLAKLKEEHPDRARRIELVHGDANNAVKTICTDWNWRGTRAVLFLDPFATEVDWSTIEAVASTEAIDVWILFPLMAVNRLLANDPHKVHKKRLDRIVGTPKWFKAFYARQTHDDIFGTPLDKIQKRCSFDTIGAFYTQRLEKLFGGVAENSRALRNTRGAPIFQLFFAVGSRNKKAIKVALNISQHILEKM